MAADRRRRSAHSQDRRGRPQPSSSSSNRDRPRTKITGHNGTSRQPGRHVTRLEGGKKGVGGWGEIPEGCEVERRGCCRRSGAEEGRDGGKKGKERSRASTPSQSYTPFPQSPPTGVSALVRARGDRRTSAQHGPVGTRTRTHAKHRNNTSEPKVLNKLWTTGGGKKRKKKPDKVLPEKVTDGSSPLAARRPPPLAV